MYDALVELLVGQIVQTQFTIVKQVFINRQFVNQQVVLRHITNNAFYFISFLVNVDTIDQNAAFGWRFIAI